jgi:transposase
MERAVADAPDHQVSLTDPDARAMATNGKGTGMVGYNVQAAVDRKHHIIVAHEVTNVGHDRSQLANMARQTKAVTGADSLTVLADRGYFSGEEIVACEAAGVIPIVPKLLTSGAKAAGRFGKQDFIYQPESNTYRCPAGEQLIWRYTTVENGLTLSRYWSSNCGACALKSVCTPSKQRRLDEMPDAMRVRRSIVEHVFGTIKHWMGRRPLPHPKAAQSRNRDEPPRPRPQHKTGGRRPRHFRTDRRNPRVRSGSAFLVATADCIRPRLTWVLTWPPPRAALRSGN